MVCVGLTMSRLCDDDGDDENDDDDMLHVYGAH